MCPTSRKDLSHLRSKILVGTLPRLPAAGTCLFLLGHLTESLRFRMATHFQIQFYTMNLEISLPFAPLTSSGKLPVGIYRGGV